MTVLTDHQSGLEQQVSMPASDDPVAGERDTCAFVAVVGMAGRFPGAADLDAFWRELAEGRETVTRFPSPGEDGILGAYGIVPGADEFDAPFFGFSPREALLLDPQHRVFLECSWEALEHAGYDPARFPGRVGVFGGSGDTGHFSALKANHQHFSDLTEWQLRLSSGPDFLTSRVSYKLGLTGPAVTVQTACSTSLVAVHTACQSLLAGDCDLALAGGVTLRVPHPVGERLGDGVLSGDGHCRAFDAAATGTVAADGAGVVVLKRYDEALAEGDEILAVLRGSAVNNDGAGKVGFTTPSVDGQAAAVASALAVADVEPSDIGFVEAHGTGTPVGDPIEVRALAKAFGPARSAEPSGRCVIGSVKSNIGHTDAASGVIGLIKTVLALRNELIPGTVHFTSPHPDLALEQTPFRISGTAQPWPRNARPRRAAVNSLGLGGTNAHVVLEEAPLPGPHDGGRPYQLLPLSARSATALDRSAQRLASSLDPTGAPLADVAWTLQTGRSVFGRRRFVVARDHTEARAALESAVAPNGRGGRGSRDRRARTTPVVFLFPGQGGQHVGMARELYTHEPVFRRALDACADLALARAGVDLRAVLYPAAGADPAGAAEALAGMEPSQLAVFSVEYALTRLWQSWGVVPAAVLGHSLGAYAAATCAGTLDLGDAVELVMERSRLLAGLPAGSMLAVSTPASELTPMLTDGVSLAAVNGPQQCVVTGPATAVAQLQARLVEHGVEVRRLHISAAAHSSLVDPVVDRFVAKVAQLDLRPPVIPWISDRTGAPITAEQACSPAYWGEHLRHTVQFDTALRSLLDSDQESVLIELGPGRTLGTLARRHPSCAADRVIVSSLPHASEDGDSGVTALTALGRVWQEGGPVDWAGVHTGERRRRTPLPTYPFERQPFRLAVAPVPAPAAHEALPPALPLPGPAASGPSAAEGPQREAPTGSQDPDAPQGQLEQAVAAAFAHALGMSRISRDDNFFDLGGDSLIASQLCAVVRASTGATLSARMVFRAPTVAELAVVVADTLSAGSSAPEGTA